MSDPPCGPGQIRNPVTGRCVFRDGKLGRQLLRQYPELNVKPAPPQRAQRPKVPKPSVDLPKNALLEITRRLEARNRAALGATSKDTRDVVQHVTKEKIDNAVAGMHATLTLFRTCAARLVSEYAEYASSEHAWDPVYQMGIRMHERRVAFSTFVQTVFRPFIEKGVRCNIDNRSTKSIILIVATNKIVPSLEWDETFTIEFRIGFANTPDTVDVFVRYPVYSHGRELVSISWKQSLVPFNYTEWDPSMAYHTIIKGIAKEGALDPPTVIEILSRTFHPGIAKILEKKLAKYYKRYKPHATITGWQDG
jgi:hypothetical protein